MRGGSIALQDAVALFRAGRLDDAAASCRSILLASPENPLAHLLAGEIALAQKKNDAAIEHFRRLSLDAATPVDIQHRASRFLVTLGELETAAVGLRHAARENTVSVLLDLGNVLERLQRFDDALLAYQSAIRANPGDARAFTREGVLKLRRTFGAPLPAPPAKRQNLSFPDRISMTSLGSNGRFGNQLLQYAFMRCYGRVHGLRVEVPEWIGRWLYDLDDPGPSGRLPQAREDGEQLVKSLSKLSPDVFANHDLWGYFCGHTSHLRPHRDFIRTLFQPGGRVRPVLEAATADIRRGKKTLVAMHLRRGDFGYGRFWIAPERWYLEWLLDIWPKLDDPVLYIASDDPDIDRHFSAYVPRSIRNVSATIPGADFMVDFHILTQADCLAISNSTFSFMAAMLNSTARHLFRPDPQQERLVPFDPWDSDVLLAQPSNGP